MTRYCYPLLARLICYALVLASSNIEAFATTFIPSSTVRGGATVHNVLSNGAGSVNGEVATTTIDVATRNGEHQNLNGNLAAPDALTEANYVAETILPTDLGDFRLRAYRTAPTSNPHTGNEPCVIYSADKPPFGVDGTLREGLAVRIHDQCMTSEVFGSNRCDCKEQLRMALESIQRSGGAIIYLQQEGRGIGLANKVAAYQLQDGGMDTVDANLHLGFPEDIRQYGAIPSILADLKVSSIQLMTNNPRKVDRLAALGVTVDNTLPMVVHMANPHNRKYLETKQRRMNHANFQAMLQRPNGSMAPKKTSAVPEPYVATPDSVVVATTTNTDQDNILAGVVAEDDGYCFGRKSVEDAIAAVAAGEMVCVVDDLSRENEGDLIMAADVCTPTQMAKIVRYSSGVICIAMEGERMDELQLPAMLVNNEDPKETAFAVTVDGSKEHGITTGISATDRATTVQMLANDKMTAKDFSRPGHIFPLRAKAGGVLERNGHTEATVDLAKLAGRGNCGVLCEIVSEENPTEMARLPELMKFCQKHDMVLTSIADMQQYRRDTETK